VTAASTSRGATSRNGARTSVPIPGQAPDPLPRSSRTDCRVLRGHHGSTPTRTGSQDLRTTGLPRPGREYGRYAATAQHAPYPAPVATRARTAKRNGYAPVAAGHLAEGPSGSARIRSDGSTTRRRPLDHPGGIAGQQVLACVQAAPATGPAASGNGLVMMFPRLVGGVPVFRLRLLPVSAARSARAGPVAAGLDGPFRHAQQDRPLSAQVRPSSTVASIGARSSGDSWAGPDPGGRVDTDQHLSSAEDNHRLVPPHATAAPTGPFSLRVASIDGGRLFPR